LPAAESEVQEHDVINIDESDSDDDDVHGTTAGGRRDAGYSNGACPSRGVDAGECSTSRMHTGHVVPPAAVTHDRDPQKAMDRGKALGGFFNKKLSNNFHTGIPDDAVRQKLSDRVVAMTADNIVAHKQSAASGLYNAVKSALKWERLGCATKTPGHSFAVQQSAGRVLHLPTWARANDVWSTLNHEDMSPISADTRPWMHMGRPGLGDLPASPTFTWLCTAAFNLIMNFDPKRHFHVVDQVPGHTDKEESNTKDGGLTPVPAAKMLQLGMEFARNTLEVAVDNPNDYDVIATQGAAGAALIKKWASDNSFSLVPLPDAACKHFGIDGALTKYYPSSTYTQWGIQLLVGTRNGKPQVQFVLSISSLGCTMAGAHARQNGGAAHAVVTATAAANFIRVLKGMKLIEYEDSPMRRLEDWGTVASVLSLQNVLTDRSDGGADWIGSAQAGGQAGAEFMSTLYTKTAAAVKRAKDNPGDKELEDAAAKLVDSRDRHHAGAVEGGEFMSTLYTKTAAAVKRAENNPEDEELAEAAAKLVHSRDLHHTGAVRGGKAFADRIKALRAAGEKGEADAMAAYESFREGSRRGGKRGADATTVSRKRVNEAGAEGDRVIAAGGASVNAIRAAKHAIEERATAAASYRRRPGDNSKASQRHTVTVTIPARLPQGNLPQAVDMECIPSGSGLQVRFLQSGSWHAHLQNIILEDLGSDLKKTPLRDIKQCAFRRKMVSHFGIPMAMTEKAKPALDGNVFNDLLRLGWKFKIDPNKVPTPLHILTETEKINQQKERLAKNSKNKKERKKMKIK